MSSSTTTTHVVDQAVMAPMPVSMPPGDFTQRAEVSLRGSFAATEPSPSSANPLAHNWATRSLADGYLGIAANRHFAFRFDAGVAPTYGAARAPGANGTSERPMQKPSGTPWMAGPTFVIRPTTGPVSFDLGLGAHYARIPVFTRVDTTTTTTRCPALGGGCDTSSFGSRDTSTDAQGTLLLVAATHIGFEAASGSRIYIGTTFRNLPVSDGHTQSETTTDGTSRAADTGIAFGPLFVVPSVTGELRVSDGFAVVPSIEWPLSASSDRTIAYGPTMGFAIRGSFGGELAPPQRPPPAPAPSPPPSTPPPAPAQEEPQPEPAPAESRPIF